MEAKDRTDPFLSVSCSGTRFAKVVSTIPFLRPLMTVAILDIGDIMLSLGRQGRHITRFRWDRLELHVRKDSSRKYHRSRPKRVMIDTA